MCARVCHGYLWRLFKWGPGCGPADILLLFWGGDGLEDVISEAGGWERRARGWQGLCTRRLGRGMLSLELMSSVRATKEISINSKTMHSKTMQEQVLCRCYNFPWKKM
jgi:hypothetical protein